MQKFTILIITEKATQAAIIAKLFNMRKSISIDGRPTVFYDREGGMAVVNQSGHIVELKPPEFYCPDIKGQSWSNAVNSLPVTPTFEEFRWQVKGTKLAKRLLGGIKKALVEIGCDELCIATDNDKEGELLGWEVLRYFGKENHPNITRMLYAELTSSALQRAYDERCDAEHFVARYYAGMARLFSDWLLGMNLTMALTGVNNGMMPPNEPLNAGRVIFCMCYLIWLKEESIRNFVPQNYYTHAVWLQTNKNEKYKAVLEYPERFLDPELKKLLKQDVAQKITAHIKAKSSGVIKSFAKEKKQTKAPLGFDTTALDKHLNKSFGMSLERITKATQELYEKKALITYPRVEVKHMDTNEHAKMPNYFRAIAKNLLGCPQLSPEQKSFYQAVFKQCDIKKKSRFWKDGIADEEAHHAIIPTAETRSLEDLTSDEFIVYEEVCKRLIMQFLPEYEYLSTKVVTHIGGFDCKSSGSTPVSRGWKVLQSAVDSEEDAKDETKDTIPLMSAGDQVGVVKVDEEQKVTKVPKRYELATLFDDMESPSKYIKNRDVLKVIKKVQIGTGASRKPHLIELENKGFYVQKKEGRGRKAKEYIHPTEKLDALISVAPEYFLYPETSAYWEDGFVKIEKDINYFHKFMAQQKKLIERFFVDLRKGNFRMTKPIGKFQSCKSPCDGKVYLKKVRGKKYSIWTCGKCGSAFFDNDGELGPKLGDKTAGGKKPSAPKKTAKCPSCKKAKVEQVVMKTKNFTFWACQDKKGCDSRFFDKDGKPGNEMKKR